MCLKKKKGGGGWFIHSLRDDSKYNLSRKRLANPEIPTSTVHPLPTRSRFPPAEIKQAGLLDLQRKFPPSLPPSTTRCSRMALINDALTRDPPPNRDNFWSMDTQIRWHELLGPFTMKCDTALGLGVPRIMVECWGNLL